MARRGCGPQNPFDCIEITPGPSSNLPGTSHGMFGCEQCEVWKGVVSASLSISTWTYFDVASVASSFQSQHDVSRLSSQSASIYHSIYVRKLPSAKALIVNLPSLIFQFSLLKGFRDSEQKFVMTLQPSAKFQRSSFWICHREA